MNSGLKGAIIGAVGLLLLGTAVALIVIMTGAYNVAATERHNPVFAWALDTTFHNSVESRADGLTRPEFSAADLRSGAHEFVEYCAHCHGAPGVKPHEWASGMIPNPPPLSRAAERWSVEEIFWITKHGVKMTGMPAFGDNHEDSTLWNIAGFVEMLPQMTPEEFTALTGGGSHSHSEESASHEH